MKILEIRTVRFMLKSRAGKSIFSPFVLAVGVLIIAYATLFTAETPSVDITEYNKGVERLRTAYRENNEEDLRAANRHFEKSAEESKDARIKAASLYNTATSNIEHGIKNDEPIFREIDLHIAELKEAARYDKNDEDIKFNLGLLLELKSIEPGSIYRELEKEGKPVPLPPGTDGDENDKDTDNEKNEDKKDPGLKPVDIDMFPPF